MSSKAYHEPTADLSVAVGAVPHGAGVGPSLSVGCSLAVPALMEQRWHVLTSCFMFFHHQRISVILHLQSSRSSETCHHLQHVAGSRLDCFPQGVMLVYNFTLVRGSERNGA